MTGVMHLWGSGRGCIRSLKPQTRILCAGFLFASCLFLPLRSSASAVAGVCLVGLWCAACGMPLRVARNGFILCMVLSAPILLMTQWMVVQPPASAVLGARFALSLSVVLRASLCVFVALGTVVSLPLHETHFAFASLPIPRIAAIILLQILQQTTLLLEETMRVVLALRVRGATGVWRVVFALPVVWMVKMLLRAERTAAAMTVRGYSTTHALSVYREKVTSVDLVALTLAAAVLAGAIAMWTVGL